MLLLPDLHHPQLNVCSGDGVQNHCMIFTSWDPWFGSIRFTKSNHIAFSSKAPNSLLERSIPRFLPSTKMWCCPALCKKGNAPEIPPRVEQCKRKEAHDLCAFQRRKTLAPIGQCVSLCIFAAPPACSPQPPLLDANVAEPAEGVGVEARSDILGHRF